MLKQRFEIMVSEDFTGFKIVTAQVVYGGNEGEGING